MVGPKTQQPNIQHFLHQVTQMDPGLYSLFCKLVFGRSCWSLRHLGPSDVAFHIQWFKRIPRGSMFAVQACSDCFCESSALLSRVFQQVFCTRAAAALGKNGINWKQHSAPLLKAAWRRSASIRGKTKMESSWISRCPILKFQVSHSRQS